MPSFKGESPRFVKAARYRGPAGWSVTGLAFLRHRTLVRFRMTKSAVPPVGHIGTDLVTGGTILGQAGVPPFKSKSRLLGVVEVRQIERSDVGVDALMLLVAGFAIPGDLAVDAFFGGDPLGDRLMTGQAAGGLDLFPVRMAFPAVRFALQGAVRLGKRTGSGARRLSLLAGQGQQGDQNQQNGARYKGKKGIRKGTIRTAIILQPGRLHH